MTFRDLMRGATKAEIICPMKREVVRRLTVMGNEIEVDALTVKVKVPLDTPIRYVPWFMDRGNMLFDCEGHKDAKLCTEMDTLRLDDRREFDINPEVR